MKQKLFSSLLVLLLISGVTLLSYPTISTIVNEINNNSYINKYNESCESLSKEKQQNILAKAYKYNEMVATEYYPVDKQQEYLNIAKSYDNILNFENGLIGYISIDKINVYLPIYHSTTQDALTKGAVHLEKTSFPVGQTNSHTVISAHSGFPTNRMFDDIDTLEIGDTFQLKIINDTYTYKILKRSIVEPSDVSKVQIEKGKELVTLVTCYPYSVNTHRLLVTGERVELSKSYVKSDIKTTKTDNTKNNKYAYLLFSLLCIGYFSIVITKKRGNKNAKNRN